MFRIDTVTNPVSLVIRLLFWLHIINATLHYGYTVTRLHIDATLFWLQFRINVTFYSGSSSITLEGREGQI